MKNKWAAVACSTGLLALLQGCATVNPARTLSPIGALTVRPEGTSYVARKVGSTSPAHIITVTNPRSNNGPAIIESISTSDAQFVIDDATTTCTRGTLPVGSSCKIGIKFAPGATGTQKASVSIVDNAVNSPQTVSLEGAGK